MVACRYFDGQASLARRVDATAVADGLHIAGDGVDRLVRRAALTFVPATDRGPARVMFGDGGQCEIADRAAAMALFTSLGHRASVPERLGATMPRALLVVVAFVAAMAAIYVWGVPLASDAVVTWLPTEVDETIGEQALRTLDARGVFRDSALPVQRRADLVERFHALRLPADGRGVPPTVTVEFRRLRVPNAFAFPGGIVVLSDELVALAPDDDAIMTVLAHEAGHVAHRDALHQLVRAAFTSFIAAWYFGDVSTAAATMAGGIGVLRYSREAEHAADLYALETMHASGRSSRSAAVLFRRLDAWEPPGKTAGTDADRKDGAVARDNPTEQPKDARRRARMDIPEYLSTHPATDERIRLFETGVATPTE